MESCQNSDDYNYVEIILLSILQVKSAFTRAYNKESHMTPYARQQGIKKGKKGGRGGPGLEEGLLEGEEGSQAMDEEEDSEDDISALAKVSCPLVVLIVRDCN